MDVPKPSEKQIQESMAVGKLTAEADAASPGWDDYKSDPVLGPKLTIRDEANGERVGTFSGLNYEEKLRLAEMQAGRRAVDVQLSARLSSSVEFTTLRDAEGRTRQVPAMKAESVARKTGMVEAPRRGKVTRRYVPGMGWIPTEHGKRVGCV